MLPGGTTCSQKVLESRGLSLVHKTGYPVSRFILDFNIFFKIEFELIYDVVLISAVQP